MTARPPQTTLVEPVEASSANGSSPDKGLPLLEDADDVLRHDDLVTEFVDVPEWGMRLRVRSLSGAERDDMEAETIKMRDSGIDTMHNFRARVVAASVRKADGKTRVFKPNQVEMLGQKSAAAIARVFAVAANLSGVTDEELDSATQDLGDDQSDASGSS